MNNQEEDIEYFTLLPTEIFYNICKYLEFKDKLKLRKLNKSIKKRVEACNIFKETLNIKVREEEDLVKIIKAKKFVLEFGKIKNILLNFIELYYKVNPYDVEALFLLNKISFRNSEEKIIGSDIKDLIKKKFLKNGNIDEFDFEYDYYLIKKFYTKNLLSFPNLLKVQEEEIDRSFQENKQENLIKFKSHWFNFRCVDILNYYSNICDELEIRSLMHEIIYSYYTSFFTTYMLTKSINLSNLSKLSIRFKIKELCSQDIDDGILKFINTSVFIDLIELNKQKIKYVILEDIYCSFTSIMRLIDGTQLNYLRLEGDSSYKRDNMFDKEFDGLRISETFYLKDYMESSSADIYQILIHRHQFSYTLSSKEVFFRRIDYRIAYNLLHDYLDLDKIESLTLIGIQCYDRHNDRLRSILDNLSLNSLKKFSCDADILKVMESSNFELPETLSEIYLKGYNFKLNFAIESLDRGLRFKHKHSNSLLKLSLNLSVDRDDDFKNEFEKIVNYLIGKYITLVEIRFHLRIYTDSDRNKIAGLYKLNGNGPRHELNSIETYFSLTHNPNLKIFLAFG